MKDIELTEVKDDSFSVKISGATFRNLARFADFLRAHDLEGGDGPWGRALDTKACLRFAGEGFTGADAREQAGAELYSWKDSFDEVSPLLLDLQKVDFEGEGGKA